MFTKYTPALISGILSVSANVSIITASSWSRRAGAGCRCHPLLAFTQNRFTAHASKKAKAESKMKRNSKSPSADTKKKKKQKQLDGFFRPSSSAVTASSTATSDFDENPASKFKVFCDLDGVLVDFDSGVRQLLDGRGPDDVSPGLLWGRIAQTDFYTNLPWLPDAKVLWEQLKTLPVLPDILTGVPRHKRSKEEKFAWCKRELGVEVNHCDMAGAKASHEIVTGVRRKGVVNVITCWSKNKHFESRENHVLIDDRLTLKKDWEKNGGMFIHHIDAEQTISILRERGILPKR
ncbi:hypothetical protein HJC23_006357 [Cyclotella cryptica]|uniref:Uncharacterized protein n=1 Tax=Cyclotella cryptica TaxID=29204 RepID=A0ABD3Q600_9STRA|eukprot:CCRYP_008753-RA/>CCRYP_008753-RA protein AED:0.32 eAED:0.32 QI:124/1/1/1/1/1/2/4785/291